MDVRGLERAFAIQILAIIGVVIAVTLGVEWLFGFIRHHLSVAWK